ncbi:type IX secretion system sortase PorU [candidate division KSB1 bacterium]
MMKKLNKSKKYSILRKLTVYGTLIGILAVSLSLREPPVQFEQDEVLNISEDNNGLTVEYTPGLKIRTQSITGSPVARLEIENGAYDIGPNLPLKPYRQFLTAVPLNSEPSLRILNSEFQTVNNIDLEVIPGRGISGDMQEIEYLTDGEKAYLRLQRIFPVKVMPVSYNKEVRTARLLKKITYRIDYNTGITGATAANRITDIKFSRNYDNLILNSSSGKSWRKAQPSGESGKRSELETGDWYVIPVIQEGVYRITYQDLVNGGLTPSAVDPRTIKIYNNGGTRLPDGLNDQRPEGLIENSIRIAGGDDGVFNANDYVIFYGRGTQTWDYDSSEGEIRHKTNYYSGVNYYWLTYGGSPGKRMISVPYTETSGQPVTTGKALVFEEYGKENLYQSGSNWYMDKILKGEYYETELNLSGYVSETSVNFRIKVASSTDSNAINIRVNNNTGISTYFRGEAERLYRFNRSFENTGEITLNVRNNSSRGQSNIYLDWYEAEYERNLTAVGDSLKFLIQGDGALERFSLNGFSSNNIDIFNISDFSNVKYEEFSVNQAGNSVLFSDTLKDGHQVFYAVERGRYKNIPVLIHKDNSDLRTRQVSADMIIITTEEFYNTVIPLKTHRETHDTLDVEVVTIENIYNEFSAGMQDPVAVRDFIKFAFENWGDSQNGPPRYILLVGDGHYDYMGVDDASSAIHIPAYQYNSIYHLSTRVTDDFYGFVSGNDQYLDIAIGRLPVKSTDMAEDVIQKIIKYETEPNYGPWRNTITFAADDEVTTSTDNEALHTEQSEQLLSSGIIPDYFDTRKIYLMEYPAERNVTSASVRKPGAQDDLIDQINEGTLILNYIGHGSERLLAHEWLLHREIDMPRINNIGKPFFFYIASCAFARWDMPDEESMAELLLTEPEKGAIGLISAARDVFTTPNFQLAKAFYRELFITERTTSAIGDAYLNAKLSVSGVNTQKYHLLGDPAMKLKLPQDRLNIVSVTPDSLKALATVKVKGTIDGDGSIDGRVFLSAYDSEKNAVHYMSNNRPVNYKLPGSGIFRGKVRYNSQENETFEITFIVPKDITYGGSNGRISLYAWDESGDASAYLEELPVGGTAGDISDSEGPEMELYFNDRFFVTGDLVPENSELKLKLSDPVGINTTGEVGHKIELSFDDSPDIINLSRYFEYNEGSYTEGEAVYILSGLTPGTHTVSVRAWDSYNNSSKFMGAVNISADDRLIVEKVMNYPNPFNDETQFTCQINTSAVVTIKIYTLRGRLIKTLGNQHTGSSSFFVSDLWDGRDEDGDLAANGTYLYKLIVKADVNGDRQQVEKLGKLVIMR